MVEYYSVTGVCLACVAGIGCTCWLSRVNLIQIIKIILIQIIKINLIQIITIILIQIIKINLIQIIKII